MKYSKAKASELQKRYDIPAKTLRVWKHRQAIPDSYLSGKREKITAKQKKKYGMILKFLSHKWLNIHSFSIRANVPQQTIFDVVRRKDLKKYDMSVQEMQAVEKEIRSLQRDLKKVQTNEQLIRFLKQRRVHAKLFFDRLDNKEYSHIMNVKTGKQKNMNEERFRKALDNLQQQIQSL